MKRIKMTKKKTTKRKKGNVVKLGKGEEERGSSYTDTVDHLDVYKVLVITMEKEHGNRGNARYTCVRGVSLIGLRGRVCGRLIW